MTLVDTSVLVDFLRARPGAAGGRLRELAALGEPFAFTGVVVQETLQGARYPEQFARMQRYPASQDMLMPQYPMATHIKAAEIYANCRWAGITPRSLVDCLIAQICIEHDARLLHDDADFAKIARVVPELKFR